MLGRSALGLNGSIVQDIGLCHAPEEYPGASLDERTLCIKRPQPLGRPCKPSEDPHTCCALLSIGTEFYLRSPAAAYTGSQTVGD